MRIQVKLFGAFYPFLPAGSEGGAGEIEVPAGTRSLQVLQMLKVPEHEPETITFLVNGRHSRPDYELQEGDVLAAFPAMAGG